MINQINAAQKCSDDTHENMKHMNDAKDDSDSDATMDLEQVLDDIKQFEDKKIVPEVNQVCEVDHFQQC